MPRRPYVIVNVAQSLNGFISGREGRRVAISSPEDLARVHKLRSEVDAILIGSGTVISDNPRLLVDQKVAGIERFPLRVVLDRSLRTGNSSKVYDGSAKTIVYTGVNMPNDRKCELRLRDKGGLELKNIMTELYDEGVRKILVEGGKRTIMEFIEENIIDEFHIYIGDVIIEEGGLRLFTPDLEIRSVIKTVKPSGMGVLISLDPYHLQRLWKTQVRDT